ncbi:MAG: hypothetical protein E6R13_05915 [Spirochaetes bacterium]|nr:MAG: hypothetical protein E6R13_05915 [Spirochaetota bacterium]
MSGILYYEFDKYTPADIVGIFSSADAVESWIWKEVLDPEKLSPDIEYGVKKKVEGDNVEFKLIRKKLMKFNYEVKFIYTPYELDQPPWKINY